MLIKGSYHELEDELAKARETIKELKSLIEDLEKNLEKYTKIEKEEFKELEETKDVEKTINDKEVVIDKKEESFETPYEVFETKDDYKARCEIDFFSVPDKNEEFLSNIEREYLRFYIEETEALYNNYEGVYSTVDDFFSMHPAYAETHKQDELVYRIEDGKGYVKRDDRRIPDETFKGCKFLKEITMPLELKECMGKNAFLGCELDKVVVKMENLSLENMQKALDMVKDEDIKTKDIFVRSEAPVYWYEIKITQELVDQLTKENKIEKNFAEQLIDKEGRVVIPEGIESIGKESFESCDNLSYVKMPDSVNEIEGYAFAYTTLEKINLSKNLEVIKAAAFQNCNNLSHIEIPDSVNKIEYSAFADCEQLEKIELSKNLKEISENTFFNCSNLSHIEIPESVEKIEDHAFNFCESLKKIKIPENVTEINQGTFAGCISLEKVELPENLEKIDRGAFRICESLKEIKIPENVTEINRYAFSSCDSLEKVELPENLKTIGENVFYGCKSLKEYQEPTIDTKIDDYHVKKMDFDSGISIYEVEKEGFKSADLNLSDAIKNVDILIEEGIKQEEYGNEVPFETLESDYNKEENEHNEEDIEL